MSILIIRARSVHIKTPRGLFGGRTSALISSLETNVSEIHFHFATRTFSHRRTRHYMDVFPLNIGLLRTASSL